MLFYMNVVIQIIMAQQKLSQRIAEESQLLAEERWIKEALTKIKTQRNCLQIERLHLESMKGQLKIDSERSQKEANAQNSLPESELLEKPMGESLEFEVPIIDEGCNEELNLAVNDHGYGHTMERDPLDIEEEEDEEMSGEDLLIDMDMLMSGKTVKWD